MTTATKDELARLVTELYQTHTRTILPRYPWVFVHCLPKEQCVGSIFLPGKQNKPIHEGVVLRTWDRHLVYKFDTEYKTVFTLEEHSNLKPGDHVLFPHWCGLPVPGYDEMDYRIVKEEGWTKDKDGGIFAVVEYSASRSLRDYLRTVYSSTCGDDFVDELMSDIERKYELIPHTGSATLSGK